MNGLLSFIDSFKPQLPSAPISNTPTNTTSNIETVVKRQIGLIIVRDKDKEKEKEKKEKAPLSQERVESKVAAQASTLFGLPTMVMNLSSTAVSAGSTNGICCAVEASYAMLREIGSYVVNVTEGPTQTQMQASVLSPTHSKRMLKTVLNTLANIPVPVPTSMTPSPSSSFTTTSSTCTVFLFSIPDERFDMCTYSPALLRVHLSHI